MFLKLYTYTLYYTTYIFKSPWKDEIEDKTAYNSTANQLSILNNCDLFCLLSREIWVTTTATVSDVFLKIIKQHWLACLIDIKSIDGIIHSNNVIGFMMQN